MQRHREVAAAPERSAGEAWQVIAALLRDTLVCSPRVVDAEVDQALAAARPAGVALIAGGHLDRVPLVLVAAPVHLSVTTVSGEAALTLEENLSVPGGASIEPWTLYLPTPGPLAATVRAVAATHPRLASDDPPRDVERPSQAGSVLDRDAFARRVPGA